MAEDVGAIVAKLTLDLKQWEKSVKGAQDDTKKLKGGTKDLNASMKKLGKSMTIAGAAITGAFTAMFLKANQFNKSMARVATLMPKGRDKVIEMKDSVRDLAIETGKAGEDIAGGLFQVISAQFKAADAMNVLGTAARAATAGMSTTKEAMDLISAATKGYNTQTREGAKLTADLAFLTNKLGLTTFPELAQSMGKVIPVAAKMNVTQEELFAGFATLTGVTGNAAEVTTQLSGVLRGLIKPTDDMKKAIQSAGFATGEGMIKALGFSKTLETLLSKTDGTTIGIGKLFRRAEGLVALFALMGPQAQAFSDNLKAMQTPAGSMNEAFKEMTEGINKAGFQFEQAKIKLSVMIQRIGEVAIPIISKFVGFISNIISGISKWVKENPVLGKTIATITVAIGGLLTILGPFLIIISKIPAKFRGIASSIGKATLLITLATVAYEKWTKLLSGKFAAASSKAANSMIAGVNKQVGALQTWNRFLKESSKEETAIWRKRFVDMTKNGVDAGKAAQHIISIMHQQSEAFRKWEKTATESGNKVKNSQKSFNEFMAKIGEERASTTLKLSKKDFQDRHNFIVKNITDEKQRVAALKELNALRIEQNKRANVIIFTNQLELAAKQKAAAKELSNFKQQLIEQEVEKRIASERFFDEVIGEIAIERAALAEETLQGALAKIQQEFEARRVAILQNVMDEQQRAILLEQLNQLSLEKQDELRTQFLEKGSTDWISNWQKRFNFASQIISSLTSLFQQASQNRIDAIENEYQEQRDAIIANVADETEREKQLEALEDQFTQKRKEAARSAAKADKAGAFLSAVVNAAAAFVKALPNIPLAITVGALGAAKAAFIAAQPLPALAEGGIVTEPTQALIGEAGPEAVIPLDQIDNLGGGERNIIFNINALNPKGMIEVVHREIIPILQRASRDETFLTSPNSVRPF